MRAIAPFIVVALIAGCSAASTPSPEAPKPTTVPTAAGPATTASQAEATDEPTLPDLDGLLVELRDVTQSATVITPGSTDEPTTVRDAPGLLKSLGKITNQREDEAAVVTLKWTAYADAEGTVELPDAAVEDVLDTRGTGITLRPGEGEGFFVRSGEPELFIMPEVASVEWHKVPDGFTIDNSTFDLHLRYTYTDDPSTLEGATADSPATVTLTFIGCILSYQPNDEGGAQATDCQPLGPMTVPTGETVDVPLTAQEWAALGGHDASDGVVNGDAGIQPLMMLSGDQPDLFE